LLLRHPCTLENEKIVQRHERGESEQERDLLIYISSRGGVWLAMEERVCELLLVLARVRVLLEESGEENCLK
jgi:hypothetical protein